MSTELALYVVYVSTDQLFVCSVCEYRTGFVCSVCEYRTGFVCSVCEYRTGSVCKFLDLEVLCTCTCTCTNMYVKDRYIT